MHRKGHNDSSIVQIEFKNNVGENVSDIADESDEANK